VELNEGDLVGVFSKGSSAKLVLQGQLYFVGQSFGVTWKPSYGQIFQRKRATARDFFKRDEDDVEEAVEENAEETEEATEETHEETSAPVPEPVVETKTPARRRKVA
jgi:hypothetical protein